MDGGDGDGAGVSDGIEQRRRRSSNERRRTASFAAMFGRVEEKRVQLVAKEGFGFTRLINIHICLINLGKDKK